MNRRPNYRRIGALVSGGTRSYVKQQLAWAGHTEDEMIWLGRSLVLAFLLGVIGGLIAYFGFDSIPYALLAFASFFTLIMGVRILMLHNMVQERAKVVETMLPDALRVTASNIKAGMVPLVALRMAARPELGPLKDEIEWVTAKSMGAGSLVQALSQISMRIKSRTLERSMSLFASALKSGGTLSVLLENIAEEIRDGLEMREKLVAGTRMYVFFILFTVIIAMPALLAVSLQFVDIVNSIEIVESGISQSIGLSVQSPMRSETVSTFSIITLIVTSILASALIGVVHEGRELAGYPYVALTVVGSIISFFIMRQYILRLFFPA
ncbi:hypothetical protein DRN67_01285 [Candidatus Micrarchaeota archaeon]|nr:MAG: hypothetical protein DRN67_01285 [Candidatus Micrarchaeota archaeon]